MTTDNYEQNILEQANNLALELGLDGASVDQAISSCGKLNWPCIKEHLYMLKNLSKREVKLQEATEKFNIEMRKNQGLDL